ncbi:hypothetical protein E8E11_006104 [Didymella keratinophila]|nr:hypothetical protein E8E11_006104 [Didymella keratinophila]
MASAPPSPEQRLRVLADFYKTLPPSTILLEALGFYDPRFLKTPLDAVPLVEHLITICVDTESYTMNTDQMTELGLVHISRKTAKAAHPPGPHGWKLQEALKFLHFRVVEHAHLKSNRVVSKGPLGNRFGNTTFTSFTELRVILDDLMNQDIVSKDPALKGCKRPVIIVGHALKHDTENTNKQGLEYNLDDNLTLVAKVDTQALARETRVWVPPVGMETNEISLRLMIEKLGFQHTDDHTACNDAARTMMCAIHMVLSGALQQSDNPSMQAVADRVEARSKATSGSPYGTQHCCIRCAGRDHSVETCQAVGIRCAACDRFDVGEDREANITSHIETFCQHVAKFKAWLRRYLDALRKGRTPTAEVAAGPGSESHPWSTWPASVGWPLEKLSDAKFAMNLIQYNPQWQQPAAFVYNIQATLSGITMASTGYRVPASAGSSTAGTTSTPSGVAPNASNGMSMTLSSAALPVLRTNGTSSSGAFSALASSSSMPLTGLSPPASSSSTGTASAVLAHVSPVPTLTSVAPAAAHEVTQSVARGHGRVGHVRGNGRGGLGRSALGVGRGSGGAGSGTGAGAGSDPSWDPANVW